MKKNRHIKEHILEDKQCLFWCLVSLLNYRKLSFHLELSISWLMVLVFSFVLNFLVQKLSNTSLTTQKQPSRGASIKRCVQNIHLITGKHPCRSVVSIKLLATLLKTHFNGFSPVHMTHIFRTRFPKNTSKVTRQK